MVFVSEWPLQAIKYFRKILSTDVALSYNYVEVIVAYLY